MPSLANPRHEAYARNRAEGLKQYDAYLNAGFEGNPSAASQLEKRPEVSQRIQEIIVEKQAARREAEGDDDDSVAGLDRAWVLKTLKKNIANAQTSGQISAANKAVELMMDLLGLAPKKGKPVEDDAPAAAAETHSDEKMGSVLDKLESMIQHEGLAPPVPAATEEQDEEPGE